MSGQPHRLPDDIETRVVSIEAAEERVDEPLKVRGVAAVYNTETTIGGWFRERIAPGAFRSSLQRPDDVRALVNHNPDLLLARTANQTLRLEERPDGLHYEITLPPTQTARDLYELVKRGDISQSSFGFKVIRESTPQKNSDGELPLRIIEDVELYDVSPVTYPAYPTTTVSVRCRLVTTVDGDAAAALSAHEAAQAAVARDRAVRLRERDA